MCRTFFALFFRSFRRSSPSDRLRNAWWMLDHSVSVSLLLRPRYCYDTHTYSYIEIPVSQTLHPMTRRYPLLSFKLMLRCSAAAVTESPGLQVRLARFSAKPTNKESEDACSKTCKSPANKLPMQTHVAATRTSTLLAEKKRKRAPVICCVGTKVYNCQIAALSLYPT
jgi:hypothetical protein